MFARLRTRYRDFKHEEHMVPVLEYSWPLCVRDYNGLGPQRTVLVSLFKLYHFKKRITGAAGGRSGACYLRLSLRFTT